MEARDKIAAAIDILSRRFPYLRTFIMTVPIIESHNVPTMAASEDWKIYYNPDFVNETPLEQIVGTFYHEIDHCLKDHAGRFRKQFNNPIERTIANIAVDLETNNRVLDDGLKLPDGAALPEMFGLPKGLLAEEYYKELLRQANDVINQIKQQMKDKMGQMGSGDVSSECRDNSDSTDDTASASDGSNQQKNGGKDKKNKGDKASKSDQGNNDKKGDDGDNEENQGGDVHDKIINKSGSSHDGIKREWETDEEKGINEMEKELMKRKIANDMKEYKRIGKLPGHWERWADEVLKPKIDWRRELQKLLKGSIENAMGKMDYTYSKRNRRYCDHDIVLPGYKGYLPRIAVVIDTSGSMTNGDISLAIGEVYGILKTMNAKITVISCDAAVHNVQKIKNIDEIKLIGGGGTNMAVGITEALNHKPDLIVVITDGYTPWPDEEIDCKVIAVLTSHEKLHGVPSWIKPICIRY